MKARAPRTPETSRNGPSARAARDEEMFPVGLRWLIRPRSGAARHVPRLLHRFCGARRGPTDIARPSGHWRPDGPKVARARAHGAVLGRGTPADDAAGGGLFLRCAGPDWRRTKLEPQHCLEHAARLHPGRDPRNALPSLGRPGRLISATRRLQVGPPCARPARAELAAATWPAKPTSAGAALQVLKQSEDFLSKKDNSRAPDSGLSARRGGVAWGPTDRQTPISRRSVFNAGGLAAKDPDGTAR